MPPDQQWQIVVSHRATTTRMEEKQSSADEYLSKLKTTFDVSFRFFSLLLLRLKAESEQASTERADILESLAVALRTQTLRCTEQVLILNSQICSLLCRAAWTDPSLGHAVHD